MQKNFDFRKITSLILFFVGFLVAFTGVVLFVIPAGRVAYWNNWLLWRMSKTEYTELHINLSFVFLFFSCFHIAYNWKVLMTYFKSVSIKKASFSFDLTIAFLITVVVTLGTFFKVVPFKTFIDFGGDLKVALWGEAAEPPYGHAELSSLGVLIERTKLERRLVEDNLKKREIKYLSFEDKVLDIANRNGISPKDLYMILTEHLKVTTKLPESGLGKLSLDDVSKIMKIPVEDLKQKFNKQGYRVEGGMTLKEIADQKGVTPHDFIDLIESSKH